MEGHFRTKLPLERQFSGKIVFLNKFKKLCEPRIALFFCDGL